MVEDTAAKRGRCEHAFYKGPEFYVAVVEVWGDWAGELDLVGLEAAKWL